MPDWIKGLLWVLAASAIVGCAAGHLFHVDGLGRLCWPPLENAGVVHRMMRWDSMQPLHLHLGFGDQYGSAGLIESISA
jgi:hypothetical protein